MIPLSLLQSTWASFNSLSHSPALTQLRHSSNVSELNFRACFTYQSMMICTRFNLHVSASKLPQNQKILHTAQHCGCCFQSTGKWEATFNFPLGFCSLRDLLANNHSWILFCSCRWLCVDSQAVSDTNLKQRKVPTLFKVPSGHIQFNSEGS